MLWLRLFVVILAALPSLTPVTAQTQDPTDDVLAVIQRNNVELPAAYRNWDLSGMSDYLTGRELDERLADLQRIMLEGAEVSFDLQDFVVLSVSFPAADRAVVDALETWYETGTLRGVTVERTWTSPERYELQAIDGRWYISLAEIQAEPPPFTQVSAPTGAPPSPPPAVTQPAPPRPAVAPAPPAAPARTCCRVCTTGQACGNSCIARGLNCRQPTGCACQGTGPGTFRDVWAAVLDLLPTDVVIAMADEQETCIAQYGAGVAWVPPGYRIMTSD